MAKRFFKVTATAPLFLQSKLLCFSLLYLITAIFLALYTTIYPYQCLFRPSPFDPILSSSLFSYPSSYGVHKYALSTSRSSCNSPLFFADYWTAVEEIEDLCGKSSSSSPRLRYLEGKAESFGGNFSAQNRFSSFNRGNESREIPCGFLKPFPISDSDRIAMEKCNGVVVVSAVLNNHDLIRQPRGLGSKTPSTVCFFMFVDDVTLRALRNHSLIPGQSGDHKLGFWRIVNVSKEGLYESPAMNGVIPKYLIHRLFPNSKFSIWVDAKLQLMVDPLLLIHTLIVKEDSDMAVSKHPFFVDTIEEAMATARWKKWWDVDGLKRQMETYCENGLVPWSPEKKPYPTDVADTAMILRRHGLATNHFSCLMFNELEAFNPRDQLAFAYVRDHMSPKVKMNMFEVEVFEQVAVEYRHNLKKNEGPTPAEQGPTKSQMASHDWSSSGSGCHNYLQKVWGDGGESHNN